MKSKPAGLGVKDLVRAFRTVGLFDGDSVIIHSSFRSLGPVDGGPQTVIAALLEVLGPDGNLMLPTFNYVVPLSESCFDPVQTPSRTGIITEVGRKWPGAIRSLHPTHSVAVIGPDAEKLTRDHLKGRAVGIGSPIDRLAKMGGKVLLIGIGNVANTTIHVGEEYAGVPKAPWAGGLPTIKVLLPDGNIVNHQVDTSTSCSTAFGAVEHVLRAGGHIRDLRLGGSKLQLMCGAAVIECVKNIITKKADILLCTDDNCKPCSGARLNLRRQNSNSECCELNRR